MTPNLPVECLRKIFDEFKDDKETLHSCLLVNRHWCKNTIDLLWSQPFQFLYTCKKEICQCTHEKSIKRQFQAYNLLETCLSCFMFNEELRINPSQQPTYERPLFNYIQFLKSIDFEELHSGIIDWIQFATTSSKNRSTFISFRGFFAPIWSWIGIPLTSLSYLLSLSNNNHSIILFKYLATTVLNCEQPQNNDQLNGWLANVICKLLIRNKQNSLRSISITAKTRELIPGKYRCKHLDRFNLSPLNDESLKCVQLPESYFNLPTFEGSSNCLSNLVEFICTSRQRKHHLLNSLAIVSKNLNKIIISVEYDQYDQNSYWLDEETSNNNLDDMLNEVNGLVNLINAQKSLSHFEIYRCFIGFEHIISALKGQDTLKFIRMEEIKIENYEVLNILNEGSRWEIIDINLHTYGMAHN